MKPLSVDQLETMIRDAMASNDWATVDVYEPLMDELQQRDSLLGLGDNPPPDEVSE